MKRLLLILALVPLAALTLVLMGITSTFAGISPPVALNVDNTVDTEYRDGSKPITPPASCTTYTCASIGDADGEIDEVSTTEYDFVTSGTNDLDNIDIAHNNVAVSGDVQIEARIAGTYTGYVENFTFGGVFIREGISGGEWFAQCSWPYIGTVRYKDGIASSSSSQVGASGQFLPIYVALTHDDSANSTSCFESTNGTTWYEVGTAVSRNVSYPLYYGMFGTSHDSAQTTNMTFDNVAFSSTITITDGGSPPPPTGNDFPVASGTSSFDCNAQGVEPGDTITLAAGTRTEIDFDNCFGESGNHITIRNDTTGVSQTTIEVTANDIGLHCDNCEYVTIDGTGKWSGAGSDGCGMRDSWPDVPSTPQCGIRLLCTSGEPNSLMRVQGSSKNFTIKGIEFDGDWGGSCSGRFQSLNTNDGNYKITDHPGEWREGILIDDNYLHETGAESMYIGTNVSTATNPGGGLNQRNNEISYNYMLNAGCGAIDYKSSVEGLTEIHHNHIDTTGLIGGVPATGCGNHGISLFEGGYADIYNNFIRNTVGQGIVQYIQKQEASSYATLPVSIYNNVIVDSAAKGISIGRKESGNSLPIADIQNNTVVNSASTNINVGSNVPNGTACVVRDNLIADTGSYLSVTECSTVNNNETGTEGYHDFVNAGADNYHLTSTSPAKDSGTANAPATDHDDVSRPQGSQDDIGAYEYVP